MRLRAILIATLLLSSAPAAGQPEDRRAIVASVDPAILAGPAPLAAPLVFAHGNLGIPRVITWANLAGTSGIAWGTTASIAAGNAYVSYNGTDMILNVPTGDGFSFLVNNVEVGGLPTAGGFETNIIQILSGTTLTINDAQANAGPVFTDAGTTINTALDGDLTVNPGIIYSANGIYAATPADEGFTFTGTAGNLDPTIQKDGASVLTVTAGVVTIGAGRLMVDGSTDVVQLTVQGNATQTALPFVVENSATTDQFTVSNAGAVVALGRVTSVGATTTSDLFIDGDTDEIQLLVQANATQNASLLVMEDSATADIYTFGGASTPGFTSFRPIFIDGASDNVQLTVQGNATQSTLPFVVENSATTDQFTVSNVGDVVALGTGTWTGDMTLNGAVGALGFGAGETIVPADGTLNVTGGLTSSSDLAGGDIRLSGRTIDTLSGLSPINFQDPILFDSTVTVTGASTFNAAALIDGTANVVQLTVQGFSTQTTLPFVVENSATTDQFTVSNTGELVALNQFGTLVAVAANGTGLGGQINVAHISGGGGSTTGAVAGTGCGTSSLPTQSGNDIGGSLGATCGTAGTTTNPVVTITFADAYSTAPFCTIAAENAATAALMVSAQLVPVTTTTTLAVNCGGGTCPTGTLAWRYSCSQ